MTEKSVAELFKEWAGKFISKTTPMSHEDSDVFLRLMMAELHNDIKPLPPELETSFEYQLICTRSEYVGLKLNTFMKLFLLTIAGSAGDVVMFIYALRYRALKNNVDELTLSKFAELFPFGYASKAERSELWKHQKVNGKNLLDMVNPNTDMFTAL